ncbi:MAG: tail fiber domain-containing protein, partial [Roseiarcus sp.]
GGRRRSDVRLKHDLVLLGRLDDGLGYYRFTYNGGHTSYVGVMAQEVQNVMPEAVTRDTDGYLRVSYDKLGLPFETYDQWLATGARLPVPKMVAH